jgi:hypothetical protein
MRALVSQHGLSLRWAQPCNGSRSHHYGAPASRKAVHQWSGVVDEADVSRLFWIRGDEQHEQAMPSATRERLARAGQSSVRHA